MIPVPTGMRVWLATGHTEMRRAFPSSSLQIQEVLRRDPGEERARRQRPHDHGQCKRGLGRKTDACRHMRLGHPGFFAGPALGQIKPVDKGMPVPRNIRGRDADPAVCDLPGRARILPPA